MFVILGVFNIFVTIYDQVRRFLWKLGLYKTYQYIGDTRYWIVGRDEKKLSRFFILERGGSPDRFRREFGETTQFVLVRETPRKINVFLVVIAVGERKIKIRKIDYDNAVDYDNADSTGNAVGADDEVTFKISLSISLPKIAMKLSHRIRVPQR